ncbi:hypothetical protein OH77DRAFT_171148 [Trametes cingulata]|nr:hypothetical protein OH77DRAFT_171148 [Trametes cingulata]
MEPLAASQRAHIMAGVTDSSSLFTPSSLPGESGAGTAHAHSSSDIYGLSTLAPATPSPSTAHLGSMHTHLPMPPFDGTPTVRSSGLNGGQAVFQNGDMTSELYESRRANLSSHIAPLPDNSDQYAVPGQHVLCVARASEERLLSTGNIAFTLAKEKIKVLTHELHALRIEASAQRQLYNELISKVPQLLGMVPNVDNTATESITSSMQHPLDTIHRAPSAAHGRIVLGLGWGYPQRRDQPEGVMFKYWYATFR